jgi:DNA-binding response OmpR family regulator
VLNVGDKPMLETRALLVDDDPIMVGILGGALRQTVRRVDEATDGGRAIELFAAHKHPVVVLDLNIPEVHGLEVLRRIQLAEPRTQVIIVTGFASKETAIEALNLHAFSLLEKPFSIDRLSQLVTGAFARYQDHGDAAPLHEAEIESLYREVARLSVELERSPHDDDLRRGYDQCLARLRDAQAVEADLASRAFREGLALKQGVGYSTIEAARRVLERDKDPA